MKKHRSKLIPLVTKPGIIFSRDYRSEDGKQWEIINEDLSRDSELWNYLIKEEKIDFEWKDDI